MKRWLRGTIMFACLLSALATATVPFTFEDPRPPCPESDPKCKPPLPPLN